MAQEGIHDFIVKPAEEAGALSAPQSELDKAEKIIIDFNEGNIIQHHHIISAVLTCKRSIKSSGPKCCKQLLSGLQVQHYLRDETEVVVITSTSSVSSALRV